MGWTDAAHLHPGDILMLVNDEHVSNNAGILGKLTIDITHQFMGVMAGPVEHGSFVDDWNPFKLIISDKRPFWKTFPELLGHILVSA
jgi:hypothetical protein